MEIYLNIILIILLVLIAGVMSGLTVGLMSIDDLEMEMKLICGTEQSKKQAQKVLTVISNHHLLLVTLLLTNAAAMEALPLVLDEQFPAWAVIIISVTLVLIFGEILPQAFCTGPDQIKIAACMVPIVKVTIFILWPISKPISLILDKVFVSQSKKRFTLDKIKALIQIHTKRIEHTVHEYKHSLSTPKNSDQKSQRIVQDAIIAHNKRHSKISKDDQKSDFQKQPLLEEQEKPLFEHESRLIYGALELKENKIQQIMKSLDKVLMLDINEILTPQIISQILESGYWRIPIYKGIKDNIIGILNVNQLLLVDVNQNPYVKDCNFKLDLPLVLHPDSQLCNVISQFKQQNNDFAIVTQTVIFSYRRKNLFIAKLINQILMDAFLEFAL